jgi:predicted  nucleic acid-binding Zn-ribbon protein
MPQKLTSKFKISFQLLLSLLSIGTENVVGFASKSMIQGDIEREVEGIKNQLKEISSGLEPANRFRAPIETVEEYLQLTKSVSTAVNKKRKEIERRISNIKDEYKFIEQDLVLLKKHLEKNNLI